MVTQIRKSKSKQEEEDIHVIGSGSHANQIQDVKPDAGCQNLIQNVKSDPEERAFMWEEAPEEDKEQRSQPKADYTSQFKYQNK